MLLAQELGSLFCESNILPRFNRKACMSRSSGRRYYNLWNIPIKYM